MNQCKNSQLFSSRAKCAICSHEVHLLVATVLQHITKCQAIKEWCINQEKDWVIECNTQGRRKKKKTKTKKPSNNNKKKKHRKKTHTTQNKPLATQKHHHKAQAALLSPSINATRYSTALCIVVISVWCLRRAELWHEVFPERRCFSSLSYCQCSVTWTLMMHFLSIG